MCVRVYVCLCVYKMYTIDENEYLRFRLFLVALCSYILYVHTIFLLSFFESFWRKISIPHWHHRYFYYVYLATFFYQLSPLTFLPAVTFDQRMRIIVTRGFLVNVCSTIQAYVKIKYDSIEYYKCSKNFVI